MEVIGQTTETKADTSTSRAFLWDVDVTVPPTGTSVGGWAGVIARRDSMDIDIKEPYNTYVVYGSDVKLMVVGTLDDRSTMERESERNAMKAAKQKQLARLIAKEFSQLAGVEAVYLYPYEDGIEVNTVLSTRRRSVRTKLFGSQLKLHDRLSDWPLHFTVSFSSRGSESDDLPDGTVVCFTK